MTEVPPNAIAIIGMACRFPGASGIAQFWQNLRDGVESISRFRDEELEDAFPPEIRARPEYVKARPILPDVDQFDPGFFGMYAREAALTDPQQRIFLECAWEALEDAGYDPAACPGAIGVFAGASMNTYFLQNVCADRATIEAFTSSFQVGNYPMLVGAGDFIATRTAYKLNLRGPAVSVQTACSTSLVAVVQACQSLLLYQSDMALAGGASISFPQKRGYMHQDGGMVAADGHCRTFDAAASGTVFGSGVGVVLLKRLEDAVADNDHIYAVIRGGAVNNDGAGKVGFTAPSIDGQAAVIAVAQAMAGVTPRSISYVECHGTATPLGDPIEVAALAKVFRADSSECGFCTLGSVKTNIGHLDAAAGVAGLIKTALALTHGELPPTLHFTTPNPRLELDGSPFTVSARLTAWPANGAPRRAGVSALGVGGTNAHVVLEEAASSPQPDLARPSQLLVLSARGEAALACQRDALAAHLRMHPEQPLADIAFTLQTGRRAFPHRFALVAANHEAAIERLSARSSMAVGHAMEAQPPIAFMFPGQGAQYPEMGRSLYAHEPVFRTAIDQCADLLLPALGQDLRGLLYAPTPPPADAANPLLATMLAQPAIFAIEYALARLWMSWGIRPAAMIGHSVGEFVAACLAGTMGLADALTLIAARGRLMQALPGGAMLSVRLPESELAPLLGPDVSIAAVNGPALCVAAGPAEAVGALETVLEARNVPARRLHTSHAFHSAMMDPVLSELAARVAQCELRAPELPWVSGVTGRWITPEEATSAEYWARHCRAPVRFADALATLVAGNAPVLLEVGPGRALATLALQGAGRGLGVFGSLPDATRLPDDLDCMLDALGRLWIAGVTPDWQALHMPFRRRRVSLPTYPFERERCWIDAPLPAHATASVPDTAAPQPQEAEMDQSLPRAALDAREAKLRAEITGILEKLSGEDLAGADPALTFLELGFDSLFLGQFAQQLGTTLGLNVAFRDLLGDLPTIAAVAEHAASVLPPPPQAAPAPALSPSVAPPAPLVSATPVAASPPPTSAPAGSIIEGVMREQLQAMQVLMRQQLDALRAIGPAGVSISSPLPLAGEVGSRSEPGEGLATTAPSPAALTRSHLSRKAGEVANAETPSRFSVYRPGAQVSGSTLSPAQARHVEALIARTTSRTAGSKRATAQHRPHLADPRAAAGFRAEWKEMVYPIVCARAMGAHIWDIDGNEYIDLLNGYGQTCFGHAPDFVVEALRAQLAEGFVIGPQSPLAGEVAALVCELTGNERATFCNTGSEAVMAALRVSRAVTGRERVAVFGGAYHGQFDEVLVKGVRSGEPRALPVAPGIPPDSVQNMVVLPYATQESLDWVRAHCNELAAVVVEPVQSRHPSLQPRDFLAELRTITEQAGSAFVFDEVVTGFRMHPGGMQALFGIRADMTTYGKVVGGGMPIGILAGRARFMDALDGGQWRYGDESYPEVAPTFFAGTFVRHPLALAAAKAVLLHLKAHGAALQETLGARTTALVSRLNAELERVGLKTRIETYGSLFYFSLAGEQKLGSLLWYHLRARGIYMQEGFPCFLTTEHGDAECERIVEAFSDSLREMIADGVLEPTEPRPSNEVIETVPTEPQTEVWLAAQLGEDASCAFNEGISLQLDGRLDIAALTAALNDVVARHDALRSNFSLTGERLRIAPALVLDIPLVDLLEAGEAGLAALLQEEARTPFDLVCGPLLRARLARRGPERHVLVVTAHHIVCDGWSMNVIVSELAASYAARLGGAAPALPLPLAFSRYAAQQAAHPDHAAVTYWQQRFRAPPPPLELPTDRPRTAQKSFRGATWRDAIDADLTSAVKKAGARQGCTLFVTLLAAFQAMLGRLADTTDLVVGIPAAGQSSVGDQILVGHCVNFLPLRATWEHQTRVPALLQAARRTVLDAYEHQNCTLGTIVRKLDLPRVPGRLPLVEVQFNLERLADRVDMPGLSVMMTPNPKQFVNFDLFLNVIESLQGLRIDVDYSTDLFDEATISRWIGHYRTILAAIAANPDQEVRRLPLLSENERDAMLAALNDTGAPRPECTVDAMIAAQAVRSPDAAAVSCGTERLTYRELQQRANQLASRLRRDLTYPAARIGVLLRRSADLPVALLAVMRAGFAYVPLDLAHPAARLRTILQESGARLLLSDTDRATDIAPPGTTVLRLDNAKEALAAESETLSLDAHDSDSAAYVIYTSGSTGTPKGVEVTHRAVTNLLASMAAVPGLTSTDRLLAVTTVAFDIAALELFLPLTVGGETVIADPEQATDGFALLRLLHERGITTMQATPSLWRITLEAGFRSTPGFRMLAGGEPLDRALADRLLEGGGELWNMYGPTETTIWSSVERVVPGTGTITIGRPIANTQFYILDAHDELCPLGVTGELCIAGDGLARGYVGEPGLTAFPTIAVGQRPAQRMYRTGDVARLLPDGRVQILGRRDSQVKLRGFRIELGEIESVLARVGGVAAAAVVLHTEMGGGQLVGYYVEHPGRARTPAELIRALSTELPDYMVPVLWVRLEAMPMTPNGKIDRKALPAPGLASRASDAASEPPRTPLELRLAEIWRNVLGIERVGVNDNLFALGADSIHMFRIAARMMHEGIGLSARHLLRHPTIAELAEAAATGRESNLPSLGDFVRSRRAQVSA